MPNSVKIGQTVADISRFLWFSNGDRRHLWFSKIRTFNGLSPVQCQCASPCQIYQNRSNGCVDMAIQRFSKMAAGRHLGIVGCVLGPFTMSIWWFYCYAKYLVGVDAVGLFLIIIMHFMQLPIFWKSLFTPIKYGFWGFDSPKWGVATTNPPNAHPCV